MNTFKKIYCRIYQFGFRAAIPLLPYRKPEPLHDAVELAKLFKSKGITNVMLVTDKSIRSYGITTPLENAFRENHIELTIYDKTVANPTSDNVEEAKEIYLENQCEALIGFGGGSSIDCAKATGALIANPKKTLHQISGNLKIHKKLPPLVAIPTTAGTGSETTLAAIITDSRTRSKYCINAFPLIPAYAVLDPEVTRSLPPHLTSTTGMDALTHAVEAYIGRSTTRQTRKDAEEAVKLVFQYLKRAYENGNDMEARERMLYAAYLAGSAFTTSYVGYVHAVAHSLGGTYNTPHGLANAVLLPYVLEAYGKTIYRQLHKLAVVANLSSTSDSDEAGAKKFIAAIWKMQEELNVGNKLDGIKKEDIPALSKHADHEGNPLYPVPKLMNAKELEIFYYDLMK